MAHSIGISFLGPLGTYSDEAARRFAARFHASGPVDFHPRQSFSGVFESVESHESDYGVVALENSLEGPVTAALDDFVTHDQIEIIGEQVLDIHHCLLTAPGAGLDQVRTISSHPQGLAQCRGFIKEVFPTCERRAVGSTAEAARLAAADPSVAAIASQQAARLYGLEVALCQVEDVESDQTSFALIAPAGTPALEGAPRKTSLLLFLRDNRPGALLMVLEEFAYAGMNLTKIQSRPTKKVLGEYLFFIDVEGDIEDANLQTALACLQLKLREVRVLGCYPTFR